MMFCTSLFSVNVAKMYRVASTENGLLYFILPQKMPRNSGSQAKKDLLFDVTCLAATDSVSVTSTLYCANAYQGTTATITAVGEEPIRPSVEVIYCDLMKKGYVNRLRFMLHRDQFKKLFNAPASFVLDFGQGSTFSYSKSKWEKMKGIMNQIITVIDINSNR